MKLSLKLDDNHLSKAMPTMRKVWQVRTTVVRGWRRRGNRKAYLRRICFVFLYLIFIHLYIIYCGIILGLHWLDTSRVIDILDNPSSIFFLTVPQTLRTRDIWIHFFFWDRQHRNKWSQKSKIRTKSTSRFDCYFAIYKWQKTNYQG